MYSICNLSTTFHTAGAHSDFRGLSRSQCCPFTTVYRRFKANGYGGPRLLSSTTQFGGLDQSASDTIWIYGPARPSSSAKPAWPRRDRATFFRVVLACCCRRPYQSLTTYNTRNLDCIVGRFAIHVSKGDSQARGGALKNSACLYHPQWLAWHFSDWWKPSLLTRIAGGIRRQFQQSPSCRILSSC